MLCETAVAHGALCRVVKNKNYTIVSLMVDVYLSIYPSKICCVVLFYFSIQPQIVYIYIICAYNISN